MPKTVSFVLFDWRNWFEKHLSTIWNMVLAFLNVVGLDGT